LGTAEKYDEDLVGATSGDRKTTEIDENEIVKIVLPDSDPDPNFLSMS